MHGLRLSVSPLAFDGQLRASEAERIWRERAAERVKLGKTHSTQNLAMFALFLVCLLLVSVAHGFAPMGRSSTRVVSDFVVSLREYL